MMFMKPSVTTIQLRELFPMNKNRQRILTEAAQTHQENMQKNLQRRLEAAKAKGDEELIRQLEAESAYLG
jgi:hypothetical protein